MSVLGLGTWPMGGEWWGGTDDAESIRTIHRALDLGVTLFDTAEAYAAGHAEEVLGRALVGRREQAVIADKVAPNHFAPDQIEEAFEASCRRLQTDYIDVYFLHWPNIDLPIGPAMESLERLRAAGRIRAIGVSNFTADEMRAASEYGQIDVLQPPYNMFWRFIEGDQLPYCQEHDIGIMAYSGLAQGLLTGNLTARDDLPRRAISGRRPSSSSQEPTSVAWRPSTRCDRSPPGWVSRCRSWQSPGCSGGLGSALPWSVRALSPRSRRTSSAPTGRSVRRTWRRRTRRLVRSSNRSRAYRICSRTGRTGSCNAVATSGTVSSRLLRLPKQSS